MAQMNPEILFFSLSGTNPLTLLSTHLLDRRHSRESDLNKSSFRHAYIMLEFHAEQWNIHLIIVGNIFLENQAKDQYQKRWVSISEPITPQSTCTHYDLVCTYSKENKMSVSR